MSKRGVAISYDLLKEIITDGYTLERITCSQGIPEGAEMIGMEPLPGLAVGVLMVFESENWPHDIERRFIKSVHHGSIAMQKVILERDYSTGDHEDIINIGGQRIMVSSKFPITILADQDNHAITYVEGPTFSFGDFVDVERLC